MLAKEKLQGSTGVRLEKCPWADIPRGPLPGMEVMGEKPVRSSWPFALAVLESVAAGLELWQLEDGVPVQTIVQSEWTYSVDTQAARQEWEDVEQETLRRSLWLCFSAAPANSDAAGAGEA